MFVRLSIYFICKYAASTHIILNSVVAIYLAIYLYHTAIALRCSGSYTYTYRTRKEEGGGEY